MATVVDICNLSLSALGDRAALTSIDPPEGSAQADNCARWFPIARDEALAANDWSFCSVYADSLPLLDITHPKWTYVYTLPAECIVVRELGCVQGASLVFNSVSPEFEMMSLDAGTKVLGTNYTTDMIALRYTKRVTDPTRYSPHFVTTLMYLLASYLAGPVIKGSAGVKTAQAMRVAYERKVGEAGVLDANQSSEKQRFVPSSVRARGMQVGNDTIYEMGQERFSLPYWAQ